MTKEQCFMTSKTRKFGLRAMIAAAVMALLMGPGGAVQAEVVEVSFDLDGILVVGSLESELTGINLAGNWDSETGDFTDGVLSIPDQSLIVEAPGLGELEVTVSFATGPVTGTVPPDGTEGSATVAVDVLIDVAGLVTCSLPTLNLTVVTTLDEALGFTALADGFEVGAATCEGGLAEIATPLINAELALPASNGYLCLAEDLSTCAVPPPPEPPAPVPPAPEPTPEPAPAPAPAPAAPSFTG
jgi:hypothetical protein